MEHTHCFCLVTIIGVLPHKQCCMCTQRLLEPKVTTTTADWTPRA